MSYLLDLLYYKKIMKIYGGFECAFSRAYIYSKLMIWYIILIRYWNGQTSVQINISFSTVIPILFASFLLPNKALEDHSQQSNIFSNCGTLSLVHIYFYIKNKIVFL